MMDLISERYALAHTKLEQISVEREVDPAFWPYFAKGAEWLMSISKSSDRTKLCAPVYTKDDSGDPYAPYLTVLYREIGAASELFQCAQEEAALIRMELFLEVYASCAICWRSGRERPDPASLRRIMAQYIMDYAQDEIRRCAVGTPAPDDAELPGDSDSRAARQMADTILKKTEAAGWTGHRGKIVGIRSDRENRPLAYALAARLRELDMVPYLRPSFTPLFTYPDLDLFMDDELLSELIRSMKNAYREEVQVIRKYACVVKIGSGQRDDEGHSTRSGRMPDRYVRAEKKVREDITGVNRYCTSVTFSINYDCYTGMNL